MKNRHWVVWVFGVGLAGAATGLGACAPSVTVSRDDEPGGTGGTDFLDGGSGPSAGHGGLGSGQGGSSGGQGGSSGSAITDGSAGAEPELPDPPENCPCTRRPTGALSRYCPRGAGTSTETLVGPAGGDAALEGTPSTIGVPFRARVFAGSLDSDTNLVLSETTLPPPDDFFDVSPVYRIEPDGLDFTNGGEVSLPYQVPSGLVPREISIYYAESPDGPWTLMADSYDNAGFEQATLVRSGYFISAYPKVGELTACP